jgi:uncharacterized protein with gpF-like domain
MPVLVYVEWVSVIDERTTSVCLNVAGKVVRLGTPFQTANGPMYAPPAHYGCRAMVIPTLESTFHKAARRKASTQLAKRARKVKPAGGPEPRSTKKRVTLRPRHRRKT